MNPTTMTRSEAADKLRNAVAAFLLAEAAGFPAGAKQRVNNAAAALRQINNEVRDVLSIGEYNEIRNQIARAHKDQIGSRYIIVNVGGHLDRAGGNVTNIYAVYGAGSKNSDNEVDGFNSYVAITTSRDNVATYRVSGRLYYSDTRNIRPDGVVEDRLLPFATSRHPDVAKVLAVIAATSERTSKLAKAAIGWED